MDNGEESFDAPWEASHADLAQPLRQYAEADTAGDTFARVMHAEIGVETSLIAAGRAVPTYDIRRHIGAGLKPHEIWAKLDDMMHKGQLTVAEHIKYRKHYGL